MRRRWTRVKNVLRVIEYDDPIELTIIQTMCLFQAMRRQYADLLVEGVPDCKPDRVLFRVSPRLCGFIIDPVKDCRFDLLSRMPAVLVRRCEIVSID